MRPLTHPAMQDVRVEGILHALSDPVRAAIFMQIAAGSSSMSCTALANVCDKPIPKSSLSAHFKVLREAGLIHAERVGIEVRNTSRCAEVDQRFPGLIKAIISAHAVEAGRAG